MSPLTASSCMTAGRARDSTNEASPAQVSQTDWREPDLLQVNTSSLVSPRTNIYLSSGGEWMCTVSSKHRLKLNVLRYQCTLSAAASRTTTGVERGPGPGRARNWRPRFCATCATTPLPLSKAQAHAHSTHDAILRRRRSVLRCRVSPPSPERR
jgi:hypothetical protein